MLITKEKEELLHRIQNYRKRINDVDTNISLYLSDKKKYPHPGQESFILEVRRFENRVYNYPDKDVRYLLDNLMDSLRIHEKIWRQKFVNYENKRKNLFSEDQIKYIYNSYISKRKDNGYNSNIEFKNFRLKFTKAVEIKSRDIASNEKIKVSYSHKTGEILLKKENVEYF